MPEAKLTDLDAGDVLDNTYRLEEQIGEGGMGRVFLATDLKLERRVAVKALHAANLDTETVRRFDRETQLMGQLDHPSVVTLFAFGRTRGVPWLAMRLLEGNDLWTTLAGYGGRMQPQHLLPIVRQILPALGYLHGRGLLHRDLKPSNIHIGKTGKVTLCDFGLARGHKSSLTRTGVVWGTPEYMAPEQILGERELDGRTDLYALAVVMFRMLVGAPMFSDQNDQDVLRAHLNRPRPDVSRLVPSLSPMVGAAMQKGLAIRPEDRFQNAQEMLEAMEMVLSLPLAGQKSQSPSAPRPQPQPSPRREGTRPLAVNEPGTLPGLPAVPDEPEYDDSGETRPEGYRDLMRSFDEGEGESVNTDRDGFAQLESNKNTQPNDTVSVSDGGGTKADRPRARRTGPPRSSAPAPPPASSSGGFVPVQRNDSPSNATPVNSPPFVPEPKPMASMVVLGIAAVVLFLLGLLVAKLLL